MCTSTSCDCVYWLAVPHPIPGEWTSTLAATTDMSPRLSLGSLVLSNWRASVASPSCRMNTTSSVCSLMCGSSEAGVGCMPAPQAPACGLAAMMSWRPATASLMLVVLGAPGGCGASAGGREGASQALPVLEWQQIRSGMPRPDAQQARRPSWQKESRSCGLPLSNTMVSKAATCPGLCSPALQAACRLAMAACTRPRRACTISACRRSCSGSMLSTTSEEAPASRRSVLE